MATTSSQQAESATPNFSFPQSAATRQGDAAAASWADSKQQYQPPVVQYAAIPPSQLQPVATAPPFSKRWHVAKLVLGCIAIVSSVILYGLGLYLLAGFGSSRWAYQFAFVGAAGGLSIIWQAAEFITICASRKSQRGIHPGAHVALHLIIWLVTAVALAFGVMAAVFDTYDYDERFDGDDYYVYEDRSPEYYALLKKAIGIEVAEAVFLAVLLVAHFTLFVRACVETSRYNQITRTVYVPMAMPSVVPQTGYYPIPQGQPGQQQQEMTSQAAPVSPEQAHLYGYYAPGAPAASSRDHQGPSAV
ncbi:hypothetical protein VTK73DRAFT_4884 [Phialemonium thermophilum]|uniref:Uncharacterized protein n=1 Tax=Phialemonium thermophilum TaxID=223376 RepID=A0ABR3V6D7_9PEZI